MSSNTVGPYVTEIPELLAMIAHGLNTKERGKLMLVSKRFFHSVGPIAWKSVPRLDCIMGLITEAKVEICSTEHFPDDERIYEITVTLPSIVSGDSDRSLQEWREWRSSNFKGSPASLICPKAPKTDKGTCPHICVLEFYPESASGIIYTPNDQCHGALSSFLSLRSFSSTTYILKPKILGILGGLEHLESLGIRGSPTEPPVLNKQLLIPETWFPSLKDLRLYDIHYEDIEVIWKQPTIVKNLTSALVQTDHLTPRNPPDHLLHGQNWIGPFIAAIPQISPSSKT
ncbi:hypothetical protein B0J17DRAFT_716868 [Rhizoctonia solani]|nr:hypothetical protein B0J17DRAFT_716868 [Rhizoctonia solani]